MYEIESKYKVEFEKVKDGNGQLIYRYQLPDGYALTEAVNIKGTINKVLNCLPYETKEHVFSSYTAGFYDHYEWETPQVKITMEHSFMSKYRFDNNIRIWVLKK